MLSAQLHLLIFMVNARRGRLEHLMRVNCIYDCRPIKVMGRVRAKLVGNSDIQDLGMGIRALRHSLGQQGFTAPPLCELFGLHHVGHGAQF